MQLDEIDVANCLQSDVIAFSLHEPVRKRDTYRIGIDIKGDSNHVRRHC